MKAVFLILLLLFRFYLNVVGKELRDDECEDYSPCSCRPVNDGLHIDCDNVPVLDIQAAFARTSAVNLTFLTIHMDQDAVIPSNFLSGKQVLTVVLDCPSTKVQLQIDSNGMRSSANYTTFLQITSCDFSRLDFSFLDGFNHLIYLELYDSIGIESLQSLTPPPRLSIMVIENCRGFDALGSRFPAFFVDDIWLEKNDLTDENAVEILDSVLIHSSERLFSLWMGGNLLTRIPPQLVSFGPQLHDIYFNDNKIPFLGKDWLSSAVFNQHLDMRNVSLVSIEPGAFSDNFEAVDLSENQLVALERDVFLPLISGSNFARVNIKSNPIECDCHLAWLIRDNRNLLRRVFGGVCTNGSWIEDLNPDGYAHCDVIPNKSSINTASASITFILLIVFIFLLK